MSAQAVTAQEERIGYSTNGWLESPWYDLVFFHFSILIILLPWLLHGVIFSGMQFVVLMIVANLLVDYNHHMSTWTRVYIEPEYKRRIPYLRWIAPIGIFLFAYFSFRSKVEAQNTGNYDLDWSYVFFAVLFLFMLIHGASQLAHLTYQYRRMDALADKTTGFFETLLFLSAPFAIYGIGLRSFGKEHYYGTMFDLFLNPTVVQVGWVFFIISLFVVFWKHVRRIGTGQPLHWQRILFIVIGILTYVMVGFGIPALAKGASDKDMFNYIVEGYVWFHSIQYIAYTYLVNKRKRDRNQLETSFMRKITQKGKGLAYYFAISIPQMVIVVVLVYFLNVVSPVWTKGANPQGLDWVMDGWYMPIDWTLALTHFTLDQFILSGIVLVALQKRSILVRKQDVLQPAAATTSN
ncbi:MAG: hypothetical protein NUW37_16940 [Planctomycetes bacterium]|nr:hypothetical protein [Planctomycetota bacterium]